MNCKNKLKEIDIKNRVCYYFDDINNGTIVNFNNILLDKKLMKICQFITFRIKL